ncbi:hypothetical protein HanPSC8_Chr04g0184521 [Helianthus annuus]|nr:hypothetical protein HanPSC8_Chr04g0184521 [Helianthus annuus]
MRDAVIMVTFTNGVLWIWINYFKHYIKSKSYSASKGVCNNQWRRCKIVRSCQSVNTPLKVSVSRENR